VSQQSVIRAPFAAVGRAGNFALHSTQGGLTVLLLALVLAFTLVIGEKFLSVGNLQSMTQQMPELGVLSLAMMVTLLHGGVNLSIISTANMCSLTMAYLLETRAAGAAGFMWVAWQVIAVLAGMAVAVAIGLVNGYVVAYLGVSPILTTLGTMIMVKGIAIGLTHGTVISDFPAPIQFIGGGMVLGVPFGIIFFLACALPLALMLNRTPLGASIYLIGSNEQATRYSGINTQRVILKIYVLSSLLAAAGGLIMLARFNSANASYGESYLLVSILAAVLGGIDPFGGFGKVSGLVLSLLILQVIASAFNQLGLSQFLTLAIWGLILIAVSAVTILRNRWGRL
jgi:ribose/xylose/arabinose/galactoside ABC-type transport system permease subunit